MASASRGKEYSLAVKIAGSVASSFNSAMGAAENRISGLGQIAKQAAAIESLLPFFISDDKSSRNVFVVLLINSTFTSSITRHTVSTLNRKNHNCIPSHSDESTYHILFIISKQLPHYNWTIIFPQQQKSRHSSRINANCCACQIINCVPVPFFLPVGGFRFAPVLCHPA